MTVEEFLDWEGGDRHLLKYELVDGVVRAQNLPSKTHVFIQGNLITLINNSLSARGRPCIASPGAPIVPRLLNRKPSVRGPDVVVTCEEPSSARTVDEPLLIIEVLSPSNEKETWESIWACATIPSIVEIVVIESTSIGAQVFRRLPDGSWPKESEEVKAGGVLRIACLDAEFPLAGVYRRTVI